MMKKTCLLLSVLLLSISCGRENSDDSGRKPEEENKVNLSVSRDRENDTAEERDVPPPPPNEPDAVPTPVNRYLSGRTELISLSSPELILPAGFTLGELYCESQSNISDREIIRIAGLFFEALGDNRFPERLVAPGASAELKDYCDYFILGKVAIERAVYGKPLVRGDERHVKLLLVPAYAEAWIYFEEKGNSWLVNGLEVDWSGSRRAVSEEKWAPSVKPSPFGY